MIAGVSDGNAVGDILPGQDDGLVSVEATKLKGMSDFIVVESRHSMMRYNDEVAEQTIGFLNSVSFRN